MTSTPFSNYNNNNNDNSSCFFGSWWQVDDNTASNAVAARKRPRGDLLSLMPQPSKQPSTRNTNNASSSVSSASYTYYTDADFAKDMNALTVQERQRVNEDIHDVPDVIVESPSFLASKHEEFQTVLGNLTSKSFRRTAWDRAVFLRPSLQKDRDHALVFLRARRFDAFDAATLLLKYYETRYLLGGDAWLIHTHVRWDNPLMPMMTEEDKLVFQQAIGLYMTPRPGTTTCRRLRYARAGALQVDTNPHAFVKSALYAFSWILQDVDFQRKGQIGILDLRGPIKLSAIQLMDWFKVVSPLLNTFPIHLGALHILLENNSMAGVARGMQSILNRDRRIRVRLHVGSWMEIQYSLRTFGIDVGADWMESSSVSSSSDTAASKNHKNPFSNDAVRRAWEELQFQEEQRRRFEAPFCEATSPLALYPNPQDIIMGKNKRVGGSWLGNIAFHTLIQQHVAAYGDTRNNREKMLVVTAILQKLKDSLARFLVRKEDFGWETLPEEDARMKVSQALRDEIRKMLKRNG